MDDLERPAAELGMADLAGVSLASLLELDEEQCRLQLGAIRQLARFFPPARRLNLAIAERCRTWLAAHLVDLAPCRAAARYEEIVRKLEPDETPALTHTDERGD